MIREDIIRAHSVLLQRMKHHLQKVLIKALQPLHPKVIDPLPGIQIMLRLIDHLLHIPLLD
ncbi:hypothetical protein D3C84_1210800 [compost metagenome]